MSDTAVFNMLSASVGYTAESVPEPLRDLMRNDISTARYALRRSGIVIDDGKPEDVNLLVAYAAWLFNRRRTGEGKPPMVSSEIRDRQVAKATGAGNEAGEGSA